MGKKCYLLYVQNVHGLSWATAKYKKKGVVVYICLIVDPRAKAICEAEMFFFELTNFFHFFQKRNWDFWGELFVFPTEKIQLPIFCYFVEKNLQTFGTTKL
jgi:hypothetical protein